MCLFIFQVVHRKCLDESRLYLQIATIVHSRQSRDSFDPQWMDLYEKVVMETHADKVTPLVVNPGRVLLSTSRLYFQPYNKMGEVMTTSVKTIL